MAESEGKEGRLARGFRTIKTATKATAYATVLGLVAKGAANLHSPRQEVTEDATSVARHVEAARQEGGVMFGHLADTMTPGLNKINDILSAPNPKSTGKMGVEIVPLGDGTFRTEFGVVTKDQKDLIDTAVENEKKNFQDSMSPEAWNNLRKYEGLIKHYADKYHINEDTFFEMIGMESHGDPFAESEAGAAGFGQLMPKTGEALNLKVVPDDDPNIQGMTPDEVKAYRIQHDQRYDPDLNLDASARLAASLQEKYVNELIAYQIYHDGDLLGFQALQTFVKNTYGYDLLDPNDSSIGSDEVSARLRVLQEAIVGNEDRKPIGVIDYLSSGLVSEEGHKYTFRLKGVGLAIAEDKAKLVAAAQNQN